MRNSFAAGNFFLIFLTGFAVSGFSQVAGDFQTKTVTGNWSDFNAWNVFDGIVWVSATAGQIPSATASVFVQAGHTISVDNPAAACKDLNITGSVTSKVAFSAAASLLNIQGNLNLFSTNHNCFDTWVAGAKIVFSGTGPQGFTNLSVNSVFINIEVNKPSGDLSTTSNFRFGSFILTAGNFSVGPGDEIQGSSGAATIDINGGNWTQVMTTTKINDAGNILLPIGPLRINGGTMNLATSNVAGGFRFSVIDISNSGVLILDNFSGNLSISTSINVDASGVFNTALAVTPLPPAVTLNGVVDYNNAGAQTISAATYAYLKLSGTGIKTVDAGTTTIPANGALEMSGAVTSPTLMLAGVLSVSPTGTTLIYSSTATQDATSNEWNDNFQNVTVSSGATVSMAGLNKIISGALTLAAGVFDIGAGGSLGLDGTLASSSGFIDGTATSDLSINGITGGPALLPLSGNISLRNVAINGNRALIMDGIHNINLSGSFTIAAGATYDNGGESEITGGGSIDIWGKFITRDVQGFSATGAAIPGISAVLNPGCTIEYAFMGDQAVQGSTVAYQNITFSGSGIKTPASLFTPTGTLYITDNAIVDASNHNIGDGTAGTTNLTMDGGVLILGTTGTQPMMNGIYNVTGGLLRFTNTGATIQRIRSPETYNAIEVTGSNVANSAGNINLGPVGLFTVKAGGRFTINAQQITGLPGTQTVTVEAGAEFHCGNADGFSGGDGTAGNSTSVKSDIETITLAAGSTVKYVRNGIQAITNQIAYQNLSIEGTGIKTAPPGILTIQGNLTQSGTNTFAHNGGAVLLNGAGAQSFAGLTYNILFVTNDTKTTAGSSIIIDSIKISAATTLSISAADTITLHSGVTKTARMARVDGAINYNTTGKFVAERYISAKRGWRFLSVPINSTQTIKQAWQEGGLNSTSDPVPGFGTQITSNRASWLADGFDVFSGGGPSMKTYNGATNDYTGISTTLAPFLPALGGYMIFIRGDRTASAVASPVTSTVLRTTGQLFTGIQTAINIIAGQVTPCNNPYASAIDLREISRSSNIFYYVWDPKRAGFGAFQTFSWNGIDYDVIPGNGSYGVTNNFIENGQAFFVSTLGSDTSVQLTENAKSDASLAIPPFFTLENNSSQLRTNLYGIAPDGSSYLADGILHDFGNYSKGVDGLDAVKCLNSSENLSVKTAGKLLVIERKPAPGQRDTIFLNVTGMKLQSYQLRFESNNSDKAIEGFLEDNFLHTRIPVNLNGNTSIDFTVVDIAGSFDPGRFRIVFASAIVLPVTFISIKAYRDNKNIRLQWKVENEKNIRQYEVEKSINGSEFTTKATTYATANNGRSASYVITDVTPWEGENYYRVRSVDVDGKVAYSKIVKVMIPGLATGFTIFPNPVTGGIIQLQFNNQPAGTYGIKVSNKLAQVVLSKRIHHTGSNSTGGILIGKILSRGVYRVAITQRDKPAKNIEIIY